MKKRSFLLFELLLSLLLVTACLAPFIYIHTRVSRETYQEVKKLHMELYANSFFCTLKQSLFLNTFSWSELREKDLHQELPLVTLSLSNDDSYTLHPLLHLSRLKGTVHKKALILQATLSFEKHPETFVHYFYLEGVDP